MTATHHTFAPVSATAIATVSAWEKLCYPVSLQPLGTLLSQAGVQLPTDRCQAVVAEQVPGITSILAIQSKEYSLIPNSLLREVAEQVLPGHRLNATASAKGEFAMHLIMPTELNGIVPGGNGEVKDKMYRSIMLHNSYSGKTPFSLQGSVEWEKQILAGTLQMRVSYFREVCLNGMMGWADEYYSLDEYVNWLAAGQPTKHRRVQTVKPGELVERGQIIEKGSQTILEQKFNHKSLNLDLFREHLAKAFEQCVSSPNSLSADVFGELAQAPVVNREKLFVDTSLPKMLAKVALERMALEEALLQTPANLWLAYNAANYALHNTPNSLTINDRMKLDQATFHHFAQKALV